MYKQEPCHNFSKLGTVTVNIYGYQKCVCDGCLSIYNAACAIADSFNKPKIHELNERIKELQSEIENLK